MWCPRRGEWLDRAYPIPSIYQAVVETTQARYFRSFVDCCAASTDGEIPRKLCGRSVGSENFWRGIEEVTMLWNHSGKNGGLNQRETRERVNAVRVSLPLPCSSRFFDGKSAHLSGYLVHGLAGNN